ncbi:MAG: DUF4249 domain-containing protein [Bacteroidales bacterium]|nr:DUF4249 domain-containing protein [Bacteroidales bacterium]
MKYLTLILSLLFTFCGCVTEYIPDLHENEELLVVEGLITDQPVANVIKIYKTDPLWTNDFRTPLENCSVWISDDSGKTDTLEQQREGVFVTDPATFTGVPGKTYTLHFTALSGTELRTYESLPVKMLPVPPVDSVYYEKQDYVYNHLPFEGCRICIDTRDPSGQCNYYRWEYVETWEFRLPFDVANKVCWVTEESEEILIKDASMFSGNSILKYPVKNITNPVDRLGIRYSILVNQYSLSEEEYSFWERLGNSREQVGGLYDIIPSSIPGNIFCVEEKLEKVLGYFSVSAIKSERLTIKEKFKGWNTLYLNCVTDTLAGTDPVEGENVFWWVLYDHTDSVPPVRYLTNKRYCGDCTSRGTTIKPDFWDDEE